MKAVQLAVNVFLPRILGESVNLMINAIMVAYLKTQGALFPDWWCSLAKEIMAWTELHLVTLSTQYIQGKKTS